jgi:hypothetical protein
MASTSGQILSRPLPAPVSFAAQLFLPSRHRRLERKNQMPKMVCFQCKVEYISKKNDVKVIEMFNEPPEPYKIWMADAWQCPGCQHIVVAGFGNGPIGEHYEADFPELLERVLASDWVVFDYEHPGDPAWIPDQTQKISKDKSNA